MFSPTYDSNYVGNYFFDNGVNMLNVAVSRAKDSFLVFCDTKLFSKGRFSGGNKPSDLLARYLFAEEDNELTNVTLPERKEINSLK